MSRDPFASVRNADRGRSSFGHPGRNDRPAEGLRRLAALLLVSIAALVGTGCFDSRHVDCTSEYDALREYILDNDSCVRDADCVNVHNECLPSAVQESCCGVYLNAGYDEAELEALLGDTTACGLAPGPEATCGGCCLELSPAPECRDGRCVSSASCGVVGDACTSDDDCCAGHTCAAGTCGLEI